jgi:hypothetical protein
VSCRRPARRGVQAFAGQEDETQARAFPLAQAARDRRDVQLKSHHGARRARRVRAYRPRHREGHGKAQLSSRTVALHLHQYCRRNDPLSEGAGAHHRSHRHTSAGRANYRSHHGVPLLASILSGVLTADYASHGTRTLPAGPSGSHGRRAFRHQQEHAAGAHPGGLYGRGWRQGCHSGQTTAHANSHALLAAGGRGQEIGIGSGPRCCYRLNVAIYAAISTASRRRGEKFIFGCGPAMA